MRIIVDRGRNAGSVIPYLLRTNKRERGREEESPIFHTNMFGETALELTEELRFSADQNERVERTYVQYKVSFPPGENPGLEAKVGIVEDVLAARGHGCFCQFFAVEHFEKIEQHDVHHLHILASTVRMDGSWVDDAYERVRLKEVERQIESRWGLQDCTPKLKGERVNSSIREVKLREQGQVLVKDVLRGVLDGLLEEPMSLPLLMARVKAQGYAMRFYEFADGKGIAFGAEGRFFKGRQLGDRFSFGGLQEFAGVDYVPERDDPLLRQLNEWSAEECRSLLELELEEIQTTPIATTDQGRQEQARLAEQQGVTDRSIFILNYFYQRLITMNRNQAETAEGLYTIERHPETKLTTIALKSHEAEQSGRIIAQGRHTDQGWQVTISISGDEDYERFLDYQERQQKRQAKVQKGDRDRER